MIMIHPHSDDDLRLFIFNFSVQEIDNQSLKFTLSLREKSTLFVNQSTNFFFAKKHANKFREPFCIIVDNGLIKSKLEFIFFCLNS